MKIVLKPENIQIKKTGENFLVLNMYKIVVLLFSCSTWLSIKFKLLINDGIAQINRNFRLRSPKPVIYPAY